MIGPFEVLMNLNFRQLVRRTFLPLALILLCPPIVILVWYTNVALDGSILSLYKLFEHQGVWTAIWKIWGPIFFGSKTAWMMIAIFGSVQLLFMKYLPGKKVAGPLTPKGHIPIYKANGVLAFLMTLFCFYFATQFFHLFPATIIYDHFGPLLGALNSFSLVFCLFLCIKGYIAPSSSDSGRTGNFIFDYFWGTELYPRLFGWDIKMFTNCRFGMMGWSLIIISFAAKQAQLYGLSSSMSVAVGLQLMYIAKFFIWETGYLRSMDIMHDRAGYAICWGCLVWVTGIYTSPTLYLVNHPIHLSTGSIILLSLAGVCSILTNYLADLQRQRFRATEGNCLIWRQKPNFIKASYVTKEGDKKTSLLLTSGWWSLARHFHYLPEILAAFCWTVPALFSHSLPYFYVVFLTALLIDRSFRQEKRCKAKYGKGWDEYCQKVPYKLIPFIY